MDPKEQLQDEEFDLDDIMKEFSPEETPEEVPEEELMQELPQEILSQELPQEELVLELPEEALVLDIPKEELVVELPQELEPPVLDTVRVTLPEKKPPQDLLGETQRFTPVGAQETPAPEQPREPEPHRTEPFSEKWEPEYEQPIADYVPPQPIVFHPRSRLRELKRKLVAGPEKRYYDLTELGFGRLQTAIFFSMLIVLLSAGATVLYAMDMIPPQMTKLMVFGQFLAMLLSAVLGSYQLIEGVADLLKFRFTLNSLLAFTFAACFADGILGLRELRVPCCAAFSLHVTMSLWGALNRRQTEMAQMDTMRKATHLDGIVAVPDYHDGCVGLLRSEGQVEDFMDRYEAPSTPEKVLNLYALAALLLSIGLSVAAGMLHGSISFAIQVLSVSLLAAVPVTGFIAMARPEAILEKRLHKLGAVLCGWQGVRGLSRRSLFPLTHEDLFPTGSCKMNGVKFYGHRDPDQVVAYCTALILADGSGLGGLFEQLLVSRNGRHYEAVNYRTYENGGIGAEVCQEPVLMGSLNFLKEMGVEVPEGIHVNNAVYAAVDGELCGVFAITYGKTKSSAAGLFTLCSYRRLRPVLTSRDFMITESFVKDRFGVNPRRICFPDRETRQTLAAVEVPENAPALALVTSEGLAPFAYAVTGARALRRAQIMAAVVHLMGGIFGLAILAALAILGEEALLTPVNLLAFELIWLIPGYLITEWTRII